jgi:beta-phosphoglucomutase-like phosphatase (HAD superfamily)
LSYAASPDVEQLPTLLLFDCDGVLVETERDGHRIAFNEAFAQKGLPSDLDWTVDLYGELLAVGGGKERMKHDFSNRIASGDKEMEKVVEGAGGLDNLAKDLHALKTEIMMDMVNANMMPPRPGIRRIIGEAAKAGVRMAICSTSNEKAVRAVLKSVLDAGEPLGISLDDIPIFAGDVVPKKKPDPAVYQLAAKEMLGEGWKAETENCVVIEDSRIGAQAAKSAGMKCIVTLSIYTESEPFDDIHVDRIFDCVGDNSDERFSLSDLDIKGEFWSKN